MITEAILSFIGAGTPPIIPSWGNIMAEGRALWQVKPYIVFFPAVFLSRDGAQREPAGRRACATRSIPAHGAAALAASLTHGAARGRASCRPISHPWTAWCARSKGLSFQIEAGETVAIVGESGCGKSVTVDVDPAPDRRSRPERSPGRSASTGATCSTLPEAEMRKLRGNDISMIFQEPMTSLNPVLTVGQPDRRDAAAAPGHQQAAGARRGRSKS